MAMMLYDDDDGDGDGNGDEDDDNEEDDDDADVNGVGDDEAGSTTDGDQGPKPRPQGVPLNLQHCTQEQATALLPNTNGCFINPALGRRWQACKGQEFLAVTP